MTRLKITGRKDEIDKVIAHLSKDDDLVILDRTQSIKNSGSKLYRKYIELQFKKDEGEQSHV